MRPTNQTRQINWRFKKAVNAALNEEKTQQARMTWSQPDVVALEDIQVPPEFDQTSIIRLWYLSHCGPDGQFQTSHDQDAMRYPDSVMPQAPLKRRLTIARKLIPIALPEFARMLWDAAGWRIVLQIGAEALMGFGEYSTPSSLL
jgi:hypothetical protein